VRSTHVTDWKQADDFPIGDRLVGNSIDRVAENQPEGRLASQVLKLGGLTFKWKPVVAGLPDRIVILDGQIYLVELKADDGALSPIQKIIHKKIIKRGVPVYVLTGKRGVDEWLMAVSAGELNGNMIWPRQ
jgi:hypothetical protein